MITVFRITQQIDEYETKHNMKHLFFAKKMICQIISAGYETLKMNFAPNNIKDATDLTFGISAYEQLYS